MAQEQDSRIQRVLSRLSDLPSLPKVVDRLLSLSVTEASTREFADLIAMDQGLSAKVLRLVNSAFYSLRSPVSSIRHASSLLGVRTLKSLALSVSVINLFKKKTPSFDPFLFWRHALSVALAGPRIAQRLSFALADDVYITGLLHDVGIALLVQHFAEDYHRLSPPSEEGTPAAIARECETFGCAHPEVGFRVATAWRLPPLVSSGLRFHHTEPEALPEDLPADERRLIEILQVADGFVRRAGFHFSEHDRLEPSHPFPQLERVGLTFDEVTQAVGNLAHALQEFESTFLDTGPSAGKPAAAGSKFQSTR